MFYLEALKSKILNYSEYDQEQIVKAFHFAEEAHREQVRKSGEAYIMHPVAVACMLADMKLDRSSVMTGLLHDTVEDTPVTLEDIDKQFGKEISTT